MGGKPNIKDYSCVLVVEGYSDLTFYAELLEHLDIHHVFIQCFNGRDDIETKLEDIISPQLLTEKQSIAVLVDADEDGDKVGRRLATLLHEITGKYAEIGGWSSGKPKIGLFVVPEGRGEIESLVWQAWSNDPVNDKLKHCIQAYIACMQANGVAAKSPEKGLVGALLALRNDDDPALDRGPAPGFLTSAAPSMRR